MTNTAPETISSRLLPNLSDSTPTGKENKIPANRDTAKIIPEIALPDPNACAKIGNTGLLEIVVEKVQKNRAETGKLYLSVV